jgi:hypothetical protein
MEIGKSDDLREFYCRDVIAMPAPRRYKNKQHTARGEHIISNDPDNVFAVPLTDDRALTHTFPAFATVHRNRAETRLDQTFHHVMAMEPQGADLSRITAVIKLL